MAPTKEDILRILKKWSLVLVNSGLFFPILRFFVQLNDFPAWTPLLVYLVIVQCVWILLPKWYLWIPVQAAALSYLMYVYFPLEESFGLEWLAVFLRQNRIFLDQLLSGDITLLPNTLSLFAICAVLFISSYALIKRFNPFLSFITALGYLLILQIFTATELMDLILSTLFFGLLLIGLTKIPSDSSWRNVLVTLLLFTTMSFLFVTMSSWATKAFTVQQEWIISKTDSFHTELEEQGLFEWIDKYSPGGVSSRSGYSENDSNLGGPLTQRQNTVFIAHTDQPHYWLIESKEIYTGKGWETSVEEQVKVDLSLFQLLDREKTTVELTDIPIELNDSFEQIPYSYQTIGFDFHDKTESIDLLMEIPTGQYILEDKENQVDSYTLTLASSDLDLTDQDSYSDSDGEAVSPSFHDRHTQLPVDLPERVVALAQDITKNAKTTYEKVRAIEHYLKEDGGFEYSLSETAYVPEGRDYVDHFLFDTKVGYCDNYSTAMVVLCRALDIPARWAKGFNSGERISEDGKIQYEVTNANAHSWPEIYFEEMGWIPFEPTPPFTQPVTDEAPSAEVVDDTITADESRTPESSESIDESTEEEASVTTDSMEEEASSPVIPAEKSWIEKNISFISIVAILLLLISCFIKRWTLTSYLISGMLHSSFLSLQQKTALVYRLFQLKKKPLPHQTFRQYFKEWSMLMPERESTIESFVQMMEEIAYSPEEDRASASPKQQILLLKMVELFKLYQAKPKNLAQ